MSHGYALTTPTILVLRSPDNEFSSCPFSESPSADKRGVVSSVLTAFPSLFTNAKMNVLREIEEIQYKVRSMKHEYNIPH